MTEHRRLLFYRATPKPYNTFIHLPPGGNSRQTDTCFGCHVHSPPFHDNKPQTRWCDNPAPLFYGWYIVGVGILVNIAGTFAFSSTLSIFLKPITEELGVSRGAFSLIRTFEIGVAAMIVPLLGPWIDRHGGRGVLVLGVLMEGAGLMLSSLVQSFWQFVLVRCSLVIAGEALLGSLVINVTIAQWFVRKRGRAMGIANLGRALPNSVFRWWPRLCLSLSVGATHGPYLASSRRF